MSRRIRLSAFGAALISAISAPQAAPAGDGTSVRTVRPILLVEEPTESGLELKVVGVSPIVFEGDYRLEVMSGGSGNRSIQSGRARLQPGAEVTLLRLRVGSPPAARWTALLKVSPENGDSYEIALHGSERP